MRQCHFMVQPGAILWFKAQIETTDGNAQLLMTPHGKPVVFEDKEA